MAPESGKIAAGGWTLTRGRWEMSSGGWKANKVPSSGHPKTPRRLEKGVGGCKIASGGINLDASDAKMIQGNRKYVRGAGKCFREVGKWVREATICFWEVGKFVSEAEK